MAASMNRELSENEKLIFENIASGNAREVTRLLGQPDVRVDCLDKSGMTPLQHAAYKGNPELCKILLAGGADVNSNEHDSGYTALMFAAISGNTDVTRLMLEHGAKVYHTNSVGRTAAQMAGFTGQHQCVSLINNFVSLDDVLYYTKPRGFEKEAKLPEELARPLHRMILICNLNPVKLSLYLQQHPALLDQSYKVCKVLELMVEKFMKQSDTNEIMAIKFAYLAAIIREMDKSRQQKQDKGEAWIKFLLRGRDGDGFLENQEKLVRSTLKDFPYAECALLQQLVRQLAPIKIGDDPTGLSVLTQGINGQRFASDDEKPCDTCGELKAEKQCSACKMVNYCNQACQKLHWFTHKKFCKSLAEEYKKQQEQIKRLEEERKKEEEKRQREEENRKAEADEAEKEESKEIKSEEKQIKAEKAETETTTEEKETKTKTDHTPES